MERRRQILGVPPSQSGGGVQLQPQTFSSPLLIFHCFAKCRFARALLLHCCLGARKLPWRLSPNFWFCHSNLDCNSRPSVLSAPLWPTTVQENGRPSPSPLLQGTMEPTFSPFPPSFGSLGTCGVSHSVMSICLPSDLKQVEKLPDGEVFPPVGWLAAPLPSPRGGASCSLCDALVHSLVLLCSNSGSPTSKLH